MVRLPYNLRFVRLQSKHVFRVREHMHGTRVCCLSRVGQNHIYAPYIIVYLVMSLPKIPYKHRIYMVLANPMFVACVAYNQCCDFTP